MLQWYQRRTQKGIGRTEKITLTGVTKNPRFWKACNTTVVMSDMGEFFFISMTDVINLKCFDLAKKNNFSYARAFFYGKIAG